jgi:RNA recognition motif-containing protein
MGFGFVNFETNEAALSAMNAMNGAQLPQGKIMKISLARPAWKANIHSNVYVSGLPPDFSEEDIRQLFIEYTDEIENIRKLRDSRGVFRGIAVIRFDKEELAHDAMKKLNGLILPNAVSPLQVRPWRPEFRPERIDASFASSCSSTKSLSPTPSPSYATLTTPSPSGFNKLSGLSPSTPPLSAPRMEGWQEIWSRYVESQMKQQSFLTLPIAPAPEVASRNISVAGTAPSLFVFHLPPDATESTLRVLFEPYGPVSSVRVLPGKGYGFVNFEDIQSAITAIHALNGFKLGNKHLKVEFKKPSSSPKAAVVDLGVVCATD